MTPKTHTPKHPTPDTLTAAQSTALEALLAGASVTEAAKAAGVTRQTVSEWRNQHGAFMAALNAAAHDQLGHLATRVQALAPVAIDVLEADLTGDDPALRRVAAKALLQYERQLPEPPPSDPDLVRDAEAMRSIWAVDLGGGRPG